MTGYLVNFSIYTLAMVGVIFAALFVFKSAISGKGFSKKSEFLNIEETLTISARKSLHIVKAGREKFLIASDLERTSLIAKLEENSSIQKQRTDKSFDLRSLDGIESLEEFASIIDFNRSKENLKSTKAPMMRELAKKLNF